MWEGRRAYLQAYLETKTVPAVMIVGQSPGFNGCGFTGIPFTAEINAVTDLQLSNYHGSSINKLKTEPSAAKVYEVLAAVSKTKNTSVAELTKKIVMTNAFQCIPSKSTGMGLCDKKAVLNLMANNCAGFLKEQIEAVNPRCIITLGEDALNSVSNIFNIPKSRMKLTDMVINKVSFNADHNKKIYPLFHPSPKASLHAAATSSDAWFIQLLNQYL